VPARNPRPHFVRMQITRKPDDLPEIEKFKRGFQIHQLENPENTRSYTVFDKHIYSQNLRNPGSQQITIKRVFL
jgi:hypothetical protein